MLKKIAKLIYQMTRREVWLGGTGKASAPWPQEIPRPSPLWSSTSTWTLSPDVELGGHRMRVCVSSIKREGTHHVHVFVDDGPGYPGGDYTSFNWWWSWSTKIAKQEQVDGGRTGPIEKRDLLLVEAKRRLAGVNVAHAGSGGLSLTDQPPQPNRPRYQHKKGTVYEIIGWARHSETKERLVIYQEPGSPKGAVSWARPETMFHEPVVWPDGETRPRFNPLYEK